MKVPPEAAQPTTPAAIVLDQIQPEKGSKGESKAMIFFLIFMLGISLVALGYAAQGVFFQGSPTGALAANTPTIPPGHKMSTMSLTSYDKELARRMMDKDNDGKCDSCGMPVEMCLDSGELQCTMGSASGIGKLGTQHIHADWKVYFNGKIIDFSDKAHMERMQQNLPVSSFIHVDSGSPVPEKTGNVLHMHATGVPLWIFFESISLNLPDGMRGYVNGKEISDYKNYVFNDLDQILITDSKEKNIIQEQIGSITNFAGAHSEKKNTPPATTVEIAPQTTSTPVILPANIQSSAPLHFNSIEEEVEYMKKNAKNPQNLDIEKAVRNMDANLDGVCDTCGMAIVHCIEGGMEDM